MKIIVSWHRFGPYHHARLRAAAEIFSIVGLEISRVDHVNAWTLVAESGCFRQITLLDGSAPEAASSAELRCRLGACLDEVAPEAVVVHGWAARDALALAALAIRRGIPAVLMSDSNTFDSERRWLLEAVKKRIVGLFSAALTGGSLAAAYVRALGMPAERVFVGYDVVDNDHFARGVAAARTARARTNEPIGFDGPFFLASARFIAKKNLDGLVEAYARYRATAGDRAWRLVILGDGELRPAVEAQIEKLGLAGAVLLPGFRQYGELPAWYGSASCFVHASTVEQWGLVVNEAMAAGLPVLVSNRCGCAADLVHDGINGFTFDPDDVDVLAGLMHRVAHGAVDRAAMGRSSTAIISDWGPERFAAGLAGAVEAAVKAPRRPPSLGDFLLLQALARR